MIEVFEEGIRVEVNNCTDGTKKSVKMISYFWQIICATFVNFQ